ncbi:hypothetical protein H6P81_008011 [Aristolochia fimbriata]|uniref:RIN4 pathogenic type III effector avirulence factor Avr cleavage site domain-containing protein n=1 Tax=Aristolochia fimbriata TaxID=158543 RepID=A0AAV7F1Z9_ARIFI|nr:hypothetical protein H6P81_008011 [Aristolochia fimbriata]
MAQNSHVPKFGNWDRENIPYTMYFENARKEKGGGKMINPNDPEQNPEAFIRGSVNHRVEITQNHKRAPRRVEGGGCRDHMEAPQRYDSVSNRKSLDPQKTRHVRSNNSDTGSDRSNSNSDRSQKQSYHRRKRSGQSSNSAEAGNSFSPSPAKPTRSKTGSTHAEEQMNTHRVASIPKFGSWDETDPKSGDGFTIIFDKVKEQKQMGVTNTATITNESVAHSNTRQNHGNSSPKGKMCCCFFP